MISGDAVVRFTIAEPIEGGRLPESTITSILPEKSLRISSKRFELSLPLMFALVEVIGSPTRLRICFAKGEVEILAATESLPPDTSWGKTDFGCSISVSGFRLREYLLRRLPGT